MVPSPIPAVAAPPEICLSLDLDWAPDHVLEDTRQLLLAAGVPATIFATHASPGAAALLSLPGCETGLHPNFLGDSDEEAVLARLFASYPAARGVRSHVLYYHSRLLPLFHGKGVQYFSNDLMFLHPGLEPFYDWSGLCRLPIYWEDDVHCQYFDGRFDLAAVGLAQPGLKVFNFHPVHLFLNSRELDDYEAAKPHLHDAQRVQAHRHEGSGIRSLFLDLIAYMRAAPARTLGQVADAFRAAHPFAGLTAERFARQAGRRGSP